jgi:transposase
MITLDEYLEIEQLAKQGLSKSEIGRRLGIDRKTVRKYLMETGGLPLAQKRPTRQSQVEPFEDYLRTRLAQGCSNGKVLLREIKPRGYQGSYTILKDFLRPPRFLTLVLTLSSF